MRDKFAEYEAERRWIQDEMPILVQLNLGTRSDDWIRLELRGERASRPQLQAVIVQGAREADRIVNTMANLKYYRHKPYGGATTERSRALLRRVSL